MTRRAFILDTLPPSVNAQKAAVNGRLIKTAEYRKWIDHAQWQLTRQKGFDGDFLWSSRILFPCNASKMDIDNAPKAIHDVLVSMSKVPDDRYLVDSRVTWGVGMKVKIMIRQEDVNEWAKIKKMSPALIKRLTPA